MSRKGKITCHPTTKMMNAHPARYSKAEPNPKSTRPPISKKAVSSTKVRRTSMLQDSGKNQNYDPR